MKELIFEIRNRLNASQEDLAKMIGTSYATVNRWENGHSQPNKTAQLRLYDICKERNVDLEDIIRRKIETTVADISSRSQKVILYHGSKSGIRGPVAPISREHCDFGKGVYMGTEPYQPLTLISDFENSKFFVASLDMTGLRVLKVKPDLRKLQDATAKLLSEQTNLEEGLKKIDDAKAEHQKAIGELKKQYQQFHNELEENSYRYGTCWI